MFKGAEALLFPPDRLKVATVQQIEQAHRLNHPMLTPVQIDRFVQSLREARSDPTFKKAIELATKGNNSVAKGILSFLKIQSCRIFAILGEC